MKLYKNFDIEDRFPRTMTIGNFDGLHIGHKKLIEESISIAKSFNQKSSVLTFFTHTANMNNDKIKYISTIEQKLKLFEDMNVDELFMISFNEEIKSTKAKDFVKNILLDRLNVQNLVLGDDAKLGSDRLDINGIKLICDELKLKLFKLDEVDVNGKRVTSTLIRNMIMNGIVGEELLPYLGRTYFLEGEVVHGNNFGKELGFPTANIIIDSNLVVPKYGVYYATCELDGDLYRAGINIGNKPSVENSYFGVEAFLIDFNENIYGKRIKINLLKHMRDEIKFSTIDELKRQIGLDIKYIKELYKKGD